MFPCAPRVVPGLENVGKDLKVCLGNLPLFKKISGKNLETVLNFDFLFRLEQDVGRINVKRILFCPGWNKIPM